MEQNCSAVGVAEWPSAALAGRERRGEGGNFITCGSLNIRYDVLAKVALKCNCQEDAGFNITIISFVKEPQISCEVPCPPSQIRVTSVALKMSQFMQHGMKTEMFPI